MLTFLPQKLTLVIIAFALARISKTSANKKARFLAGSAQTRVKTHLLIMSTFVSKINKAFLKLSRNINQWCQRFQKKKGSLGFFEKFDSLFNSVFQDKPNKNIAYRDKFWILTIVYQDQSLQEFDKKQTITR